MTVIADCFYNHDEMYKRIEKYATENGLTQTLRALPFANEQHAGQFRKGKNPVPYIYHPLLVTCHAISLGIGDDNLLSACLLHDVLEDCDVSADQLPVNEETKRAVQLVTKTAAYRRPDGTGEAEYYSSIAENDIAIMVKILDRVNNISAMAGGFTREKMLSYIVETEKLIYPLIDKAKATWNKYEHPVFLIEYQMKTMIESLKRVL